MLRTLIVDDEAPARERLKRLLLPLCEAGRVEIVGEAADAFAALEQLGQAPVDLLLLDVQMPEMDGFALLERIAPEARPAVVFATAYDTYAIRAFEANAADYLLKPISGERLADAVARAERARRQSEPARAWQAKTERLLDWLDAQSERPPAPRPAPGGGAYLKQLSIPQRERILLAPVARLIVAEVVEGITRVHLAEDGPAGPRPKLRQYTVGYTLDQLEDALDPELFMRVHRSAIVQVEQITELIPWFSGRYKLLMAGGHEVIASRDRSKMLRDKLML